MARTGIRATARIPTDRLEALPFGPLTDRTAHICIDMQNVFAEETPWDTPWMARVLPVVTRIAERHPSQTVLPASSRHHGPTGCRAAGSAITSAGES